MDAYCMMERYGKGPIQITIVHAVTLYIFYINEPYGSVSYVIGPLQKKTELFFFLYVMFDIF